MEQMPSWPVTIRWLKFVFDVPSTATLQQGVVYARFRLGCEPDMDPTGLVVGGEVEDYHFQVGKIGNWVWIDENNNGLQDDPAANGLNGVEVQLIFAGPDEDLSSTDDNHSYTLTTRNDGANDGTYYFCGLIPGKYQVGIPSLPVGFEPASSDVAGSELTDSDHPQTTMFTITSTTNLEENENSTADNPGSINEFPDQQDDIRFDFGVVTRDYGDLPESYTTSGNGAPSQIVDIDLYLGNCVDAEPDGNPESMAGFMTDGDDNTGTNLYQFGICTEGDENGIDFPTPMIPGYEACIEVTAVNNTGSDAVLQGWIDFNGNGLFENSEQLTSNDFSPAGAVIPNGGVSAEQFCFSVPPSATFSGGVAFSRFRVSSAGGLNFDWDRRQWRGGRLQTASRKSGQLGLVRPGHRRNSRS